MVLQLVGKVRTLVMPVFQQGWLVAEQQRPCALQVCSNKMNKSVVVIVEIRHWVNKYRAWKTSLRKYMAHDGENTCNIGDVVKIEQIPVKLSRRKAFNVIEILQREKIVLEGDASEKSVASLGGAFSKRPTWAQLSPAAADAISRATSQYSSQYQLSEEARRIARSLPGWDDQLHRHFQS
jgi:small subunit ribosomal protein S17